MGRTRKTLLVVQGGTSSPSPSSAVGDVQGRANSLKLADLPVGRRSRRWRVENPDAVPGTFRTRGGGEGISAWRCPSRSSLSQKSMILRAAPAVRRHGDADARVDDRKFLPTRAEGEPTPMRSRRNGCGDAFGKPPSRTRGGCPRDGEDAGTDEVLENRFELPPGQGSGTWIVAEQACRAACPPARRRSSCSPEATALGSLQRHCPPVPSTPSPLDPRSGVSGLRGLCDGVRPHGWRIWRTLTGPREGDCWRRGQVVVAGLPAGRGKMKLMTVRKIGESQPAGRIVRLIRDEARRTLEWAKEDVRPVSHVEPHRAVPDLSVPSRRSTSCRMR
jgi:hypothetical protein